MQIRHLKVENFRGIKALEWTPSAGTNCLIGPGDSTKSTILDAIEMVLSPKWQVAISDVDFHALITDEPISITATVGALPRSLLKDDKFGLELRGWSAAGELHDEPEPDDEPVISVRFQVDKSLEPTWAVVNDRREEGRTIGVRDRERLGLIRLGGDVDRHLAWGRSSALTRTTEGLEGVGALVAAAYREARNAVKDSPLEGLTEAAEQAQAAAEELGVRVATGFSPRLEVGAVFTSAGQLVLSDGEVPVRLSGLASRRLVALGIQGAAVQEGAILVIDEVEQGLEPHRLRHLLSRLCALVGTAGQVFMTTHSPIAVVELEAIEINLVRAANGQISIKAVPSVLQSTARKYPEALLSRKILVCEGKTELGLCRGLRARWGDQKGVPVAHSGTGYAYGEGASASKNALKLRQLGFEVALLADSDVPLNPTAAILTARGVTVIQWSGRRSTEEQVCADVPFESLLQAIAVASSEVGDSVVEGETRSELKTLRKPLTGSIEAWPKQGVSEADVRMAFGKAAKRCSWFKRIDLGERLGEVVGVALDQITGSDLAVKLNEVGDWIYAE